MGRENNFWVLFIEKDPDSLHLVKKSLEENSRFPAHVDSVPSFDQAIEKLKDNSYNLLLMESDFEKEEDFQLPDKIREMKEQLPFVLMTSIRDDTMARKAIQQGYAELIVKSEAHFTEIAEKLQKCYSQFSRNNNSVKSTPKRRSTDERDRMLSETEEKEAFSSGKNYSVKDELTGLYTHSYLYDRVVQEFSLAARHKYPLSCIMIDIDHFKSINDKYGHRTGDLILKECAGLLFENCRLSDLIARHGGEEFVILMPHVDYAGAKELANRLRALFAEHPFCAKEGDMSEAVGLTVSLGISSFPEDTMERRAELLSYASQGVFRSKAAGRNRVTLYKEIVPVFGEELPVLKISEEKVIEFQRKLSEVSNMARRATIDASKALISALENKDRFTAGHAASCAKYCMQVAEAMGMSLEEAEVVEHAALLHDIGKICIPDNILLKPGRLSFSEFEAMKQHPYLGYKILKPIKFLQQESILVLHHHEWYNGEGYPCRLKANEIPLGARIISVIDSYDTMRIAGGRYKKTCSVEKALDELIAYAGIQFDPAVVQAFIQVLKARKELQTEDYDKARLEKALLAVSNSNAA